MNCPNESDGTLGIARTNEGAAGSRSINSGEGSRIILKSPGMKADHNPLAPKQNDKLPFWKQTITLPLVLWVLLHVVLTAWLSYLYISTALEEGQITPRDTGGAWLLFLVSFAIVAFCLAVVRKLGELTLRPFRRRQQRVRRER